MINLSTKNNLIMLQSPYSETIIAKIKSIPGRKWNHINKVWTIPFENADKIYNVFDESYINATDNIKAYIASLNGTGFFCLKRISKDVIELTYQYRSDISDIVKTLPYKLKLDVNDYIINDEEAVNLIGRLGKHRAIFEKEELSLFKPVYYVHSEQIYLDYQEPIIIVHCSYETGKYLHNLISSIVYSDKNKSYVMPLHNLPELIALEGKTNVITTPEIDKQLKNYLRKELPVKERLKDIRPIFNFNFKTKPLSHQIEAFNFGMEHNRILIADAPGLGKTLESLTIACARIKENPGYKRNVLIVCGVNSVKYNWQEEIEKHTYEKSIVFKGSSSERKVKMIKEWLEDDNTLFGIINIEALRNENICKLFNDNISIIIVDEIHKAKNGSSIQGKALRELNGNIKIGLSGTPMTNKPEDLWNILSWLDVEPRNYWQFRNAYCILGGPNGRIIVDYKNMDELSKSLKEVMLRRKKEDVLDLPPKLYKKEYVELSSSQKADYKDAESGILKVLNKILEAKNPLTKLLRLRQVTSGFFSEEKDDAKMSRVKEILSEEIIPSGEKAIIFSQYETTAEYYRSAFQKYNPAFIVGKVAPEERQKEVNRFQNDASCKLAIGTIGAMGTGLTMTSAGYVIFIDKDWAQTNNEQAEDRAYRIGTTKNVTILSMIAKDTIDEHIEDVLEKKAELFENIVEGKAIENESKKALIYEVLGLKSSN